MKKRRRSLRLPRQLNPKNISSTCFVSCSDANYFPLLVEWMSSLKCTQWYKGLPIYILDGGMTEAQQKMLRNSGINVVQSEIVLPISTLVTLLGEKTDLPQHLVGVLNKAFLPQLIPGYEYYFWMNPNCWIQDERALDVYLTLASQQKLAHSHSVQTEIDMHILGSMSPKYLAFVPTRLLEECSDRLHGSDAVFCAHRSFFAECAGWIRELTEDGRYFYYLFELLQTLYMKRHNLSAYVDPKWYAHTNHTEQLEGYTPAIRSDDVTTLYTTAFIDHPVGIVRPVSKYTFNDALSLYDVNRQEFTGQVPGSTRFFLR